MTEKEPPEGRKGGRRWKGGRLQVEVWDPPEMKARWAGGWFPEWELLVYTPAVFVRVASKGLTVYGTWKSVEVDEKKGPKKWALGSCVL
jgi:hypothetical protein